MRRRALRSVTFDASVACRPAACKPTFELAAAALPVAAGPESASPAAMTATPIHRFMATFSCRIDHVTTGPRRGPVSQSHSRTPEQFQARHTLGHDRGVKTGSRQENASTQESRAPFRFYRNGKDSGAAPDITSGDGANGDDASGDDASAGDASAGDASAGDGPNDDGGGASALGWSSPWYHPEPRRRRRDWPAIRPGRVRRERSA
jgi:hypothetical protein